MAATQENRPRGIQKARKKTGPMPFVIVCAAIIIIAGFFFRVKTIEVVGTAVYSHADIIAASGIQEGDNLFFINKSSATSQILSQFPAVDNATVDREMPGKIIINISESAAIACIDVQGEYWSLDHSMRFLEKIGREEAKAKIQIKGITAESPIIGTTVDASASVSQALELMGKYGMLPYVSWVELRADDTLQFDYLDRFTVKIPVEGDMDINIQKLLSAVSQLSPGDRALLDLSIDDKVHYQPR